MRTPAILTLATVLSAFPGAALAQSTDPESGRTPASHADARRRVEQERARQAEEAARASERITIDFRGGLISEYIRALREAAKPHVVNVVAPESVLTVSIGELSLRGVSIETAVRAIEWAIPPRGVVAVQQIGESTFAVVDNSQHHQPPPSAGKSIQVLSLRDLTEPLPGDPPDARLTVSPDVVLTAIQTAIDSSRRDGEPAEMKYHSDSGLIIIHGTQPQISAAMQALSSMQNDLRTRRMSLRDASQQSRKAGENIDQLRAEVELQQVRVNLLEQALARKADELARAEKKDLPDEVAARRAAVERAAAEVDAARINAELGRARLLQQVRQAGPGLPEGRSAITYAAGFLSDPKSQNLPSALSTLAAAAGDDRATVVLQKGGTLVVTASRPAHEAVAHALRGLAAANGSELEQRRVQPADDANPKR